MKTLHEVGGLVLAVYDKKNYVIYEKDNPSEKEYYSQMEHAITALSRRVADETASDLSEWIKALQEVHTALERLVSVQPSKD